MPPPQLARWMAGAARPPPPTPPLGHRLPRPRPPPPHRTTLFWPSSSLPPLWIRQSLRFSSRIQPPFSQIRRPVCYTGHARRWRWYCVGGGEGGTPPRRRCPCHLPASSAIPSPRSASPLRNMQYGAGSLAIVAVQLGGARNAVQCSRGCSLGRSLCKRMQKSSSRLAKMQFGRLHGQPHHIQLARAVRTDGEHVPCGWRARAVRWARACSALSVTPMQDPMDSVGSREIELLCSDMAVSRPPSLSRRACSGEILFVYDPRPSILAPRRPPASTAGSTPARPAPPSSAPR
ncbi:hypothetical protein VPH35_020729 [Triticum aestivum]